MPRYAYLCEKCNKSFQVAHSIKEKLTDCEECNSEGTLKRVPSIPFVFSEKKRAGKLVDKHIEETKKEVEAEKKRLKGAEYK
jgi:putative FmdB family regulatory protein